MTITLRISLDGEIPTGHASDDHGLSRDFAGWVGLVAAIDGLLSGPQEDQSAGEDKVGP
jgi:hypothetical protein